MDDGQKSEIFLLTYSGTISTIYILTAGVGYICTSSSAVWQNYPAAPYYFGLCHKSNMQLVFRKEKNVM
jgi:hypothetical protein